MATLLTTPYETLTPPSSGTAVRFENGQPIVSDVPIIPFIRGDGTAPKHAGLDRINPASVSLSGVMMLESMGWQEAADLITRRISAAIVNRQVTYKLVRLMEPHVGPLSCSGCAEAVIIVFEG